MEMINSNLYGGVTADDFQLLCKNGQRLPITDYIQCNWGLVPSNALATSSALKIEERKQFQRFLTKAVRLYSDKKYQSFNTSNDLNNRYNNFGDGSSNRNQFYNNEFSRDRNVNNIDVYGRNNQNQNRNQLNDHDNENSTLYEKFDLFTSARYGKRLNLMFQVNN
jgi:melanoma-associated antigen p97